MIQVLTSYSDREFKEILSEQVKEAVRTALLDVSAVEQVPSPPIQGYRTRTETKRMLGVAYSTMHYWEKAGILVPRRIGRKVYYSDETIGKALETKGGKTSTT